MKDKLSNAKSFSYMELKAPITAQMELTPRCNNSCLYCYNYWRGDRKYENELNLEESLKIATKLADNEIFGVVLTGGEPLLRRDLVYPLANYFSSKEIDVKMNTNLTMLNKEDTQKIKDSGISSLFAPLPSSNEKTYSEITRTKNFRKAISGIELAVKQNIPLALNMVIIKSNKHQVYETGKFVRNLGVSSFAATPAIPCVYLEKKFELTNKDIMQTLDDLLALEKEFGMNVGIVETIPRCAVRDPQKYEKFLGRDCGVGRTTIAISSSGNIRPCTHSPKEYGNLLKENLTDIWQRMKGWRNGNFVPRQCSNCNELELCSLGCREAAKTKCGSYKGLDPRALPENIQDTRKILRRIPEVDTSTKFSVIGGLKYRNEKKGMLIFSPRNSAVAYMNQQFFNFLIYLKKKDCFTIDELSSEFKENKKEQISDIVKFLNAKGLIKKW